MDPVFQTSLLVPPHDIDFSNRLKVSAFFHLMQSAASQHAEQLELGYQSLQAAGLFWVLSWVKIEVESYPQYRDRLVVATWPHSRYRLYSLRDFLFTNGKGEVAARARTGWLPVDAATKRITSPDRLPHRVPYYAEQTAMDAYPEKMPTPVHEERVQVRQVVYSDLDLNQHTNSARYIDVITDSYPLAHHQAHCVRSLVISFLAESRFGDHLEIFRSFTGSGRHQVSGRRQEDGKQVFQALVDWGADPD